MNVDHEVEMLVTEMKRIGSQNAQGQYEVQSLLLSRSLSLPVASPHVPDTIVRVVLSR